MDDNFGVSIKQCSKFRTSISTQNLAVFEMIKSFFTITEKAVFRTKKLKTLMTKFNVVKLYTVDKKTGELFINTGLCDYLVAKLATLKVRYPEFEINITDSELTFDIEISEKWKNILRSHPKGEDFGQMQLDDLTSLVSFRGGIAELYTGYGKTELICAIVDSTDVPVVILTPQTSITTEIKLRLEKYGIDVGLGDWSKRINIINPMGFMRSKASSTKEAAAWLKTVKIVITDEAHHLSANSYLSLFNFLENVERSYGFSASPDTVAGVPATSADIAFEKLGSKLSTVISLCGLSRIKRKLPIDITLIKIFSKISEKLTTEEKDQDMSWIELLDRVVESKNLAIILASIIKKYPDRIFFIPVHKKETGTILFNNLITHDVKGFYWDANVLLPQQENKEHLKVLKQNLGKNPEIRFLISTSIGFEGVDIPAINAVIPLTGSNFRTVIQPVGRAARASDVLVFLLFDTHSPVLMDQAQSRKRKIFKEFKVVSTHTINLN